MWGEMIKIVLWLGKTLSLGNLLKRNSVCKSKADVEEHVWYGQLDLKAGVQGVGSALGRNPESQEAMDSQALGSQRAQRAGALGKGTDPGRERQRSQRLGKSSETRAQDGVRGWMKAQGFLCWGPSEAPALILCYCAMNKWVCDTKHLRLLRETCSECICGCGGHQTTAAKGL